jgi:hypothetical protein
MASRTAQGTTPSLLGARRARDALRTPPGRWDNRAIYGEPQDDEESKEGTPLRGCHERTRTWKLDGPIPRGVTCPPRLGRGKRKQRNAAHPKKTHAQDSVGT